jgi:glutathione synthase/RimK-type ligase-like ATP-grasp enzyme
VAVLVIAKEEDPHTRAVVDELHRLGAEVVVADLSEFPQRATMSLRYGCCGDRGYVVRLRGVDHDLDRVGAVWWRRPQHPRISGEIVHEQHRLFAANEASEALSGLWYALDAFWLNDPARDHVAHRKVLQLKVAQECGLEVPDTLITNDPDEARRFVDRHGYRNVIYKSFSAFEDEWRETRILRDDELALLDHVRFAPVIFQEYVEAEVDLRITVVGDEVFPAAIHSQQTSYPVDFRMDMQRADITPAELPGDVLAGLRALMSSLGLVYGAIDMRRRPDGEHRFLEINPAGQWLFVEQVTGQPIAAAIARTLATQDREAGVRGTAAALTD